MIWKPAAMKRARELAAELNRPNWDSYCAKPITAESVARFEVLLSTLPDHRRPNHKPWVTPDVNGNIEVNIGDIEIGSSDVYAIVGDREYEGPLSEMPREMLAEFFEIQLKEKS